MRVCVCAADEVPGSAVLVFNIELVDMEEGLPEGYMFIWNSDVSPDLFSEMDKDENKLVEPSEVGELSFLSGGPDKRRQTGSTSR